MQSTKYIRAVRCQRDNGHKVGVSHVPVKGKGHPITGHSDPGEAENIYSSTFSSASALDGVGCQRHATAALPRGKTWCPFYRRLGGPQGLYGPVRIISPPPSPTGIRSPDRPARSESLYRLSCPDAPFSHTV